jgi:hypothetical protein
MSMLTSKLLIIYQALRLLPKQSTAGLTGGSYISSVSNPSLKRQTTLVLQREPAEVDPWIVDMHIHIWVDGENKTTTLARGLLDTQSDVSLISGKQVAALGLEHMVLPTNVMDPIRVYTLGKGITSSITPRGSLPIRWHINKHEGRIYNEEFLVLPDALEPHFDFLISKHFIAQHQFLLRNPAVLYLRRARTGDLSAAK